MGRTFDRDLKRLLFDAGWRFVRNAKGSHEVWKHPQGDRSVIVPHGIVKRHTANAILKQVGLPKAF